MSCIEHFGHYDGMTEFSEHSHTSCELLYLHDGEVAVTCGEKTFMLKSGMLYIIPSCVPHRTSITDPAVYRRTLVFLNPWSYCGIYYSERIKSLLFGAYAKELVCAADDFHALELFDRIEEELEKNDPLSEDVIVSAVTQILAGLLRSAAGKDISAELPDALVSEVGRYIQENSGTALKISDIADRFYISKYYLTHIFKEQTGMSPRQFLSFTRLSKAHSMLHEPKLKISEISEICGFTSPSDMTKKFRLQYGVTPTQLRQALFAPKSKKAID